MGVSSDTILAFVFAVQLPKKITLLTFGGIVILYWKINKNFNEVK